MKYPRYCHALYSLVYVLLQSDEVLGTASICEDVQIATRNLMAIDSGLQFHVGFC